MDFPFACQGDKLHLTLIARLETNRGAGWNIEPETSRGITIKAQRLIDLKKMEVTADLDRTVPGICHQKRFCRQADVRVQGCRSILGNDFSGDHDIYRIG